MMSPKAEFTWRMFPRATGWTTAWDPKSLTYDQSYVDASSLEVEFSSGKSSAPGDRIVSTQWNITGVDNPSFHATMERKENKTKGKSFKHNIPVNKIEDIFDEGGDLPGGITIPPGPVRLFLPGLGRYRVRLTVKSDKSGSAATEEVIEVKDTLVVSLGDSAASGEGNPDRLGHGDLIDIPGEDWVEDLFDPDVNPIWTDQRCHRSHFSGHALAAASLETPHSTVTFLSFACSGAKIGEGVVDPYSGAEAPSDGSKLPGQIDALAKAIGTKRDVDILLITAGINDLGIGNSGFSSIIEAFADPRGDMSKSARDAVTGNLRLQDDRYDLLASSLSKRLDGRVRQVYITQYPGDIFNDDSGHRGGCGLLKFVSESEAEFLFEQGKMFNQKIREAAERHGWHAVTGLTEAFHGHGYCCKDPWYLGLSQSVTEQLNVDGTVHPNHAGHRAIRDKILETIRSEGSPVHHSKVVTIDFEKVRVVDELKEMDGLPFTPPPVAVTFSANTEAVQTQLIEVGKEHTFPPGKFRVRCLVSNGLVGTVKVAATTLLIPEEKGSPRPRGDDSRTQPQLIRRVLAARSQFGISEGYGEGQHHSTGRITTGSIEVSYKIKVEVQRPKLPTFPTKGILKGTSDDAKDIG
jgi:hypothetical protein